MTQYFDNTRLSTFKSCPRKFYFRHVRHWRGDGTSHALIFGLSWHDGMDELWKTMAETGNVAAAVDDAMAAFMNRWTSEGMPEVPDLEQLEKLKFRNPGVANEMFYAYAQARATLFSQMELVDVEKPFAVPIFDDHTDTVYIGRRDKDFKINGKLVVGEHKTTSMYKGRAPHHEFRDDYIEGWGMNSQIDGYLFSSRVDYQRKDTEVWVDVALVHKTTHNKFMFIPVDRMTSQLDAWLADAQYWVTRINEEKELLNATRDTFPTGCDELPSALTAFPRNTGNCIEVYGKCPYFDLCRFNSNPERLTAPPSGFIHEKWAPFDLLNVQALGLTPEED